MGSEFVATGLASLEVHTMAQREQNWDLGKHVHRKFALLGNTPSFICLPFRVEQPRWSLNRAIPTNSWAHWRVWQCWSCIESSMRHSVIIWLLSYGNHLHVTTVNCKHLLNAGNLGLLVFFIFIEIFYVWSYATSGLVMHCYRPTNPVDDAVRKLQWLLMKCVGKEKRHYCEAVVQLPKLLCIRMMQCKNNEPRHLFSSPYWFL